MAYELCATRGTRDWYATRLRGMREAPAWARDLSTPGLASWSVPSAAYGATREVFARFEDVPTQKARVAATMFPPADGAPLALARRFLPSESATRAASSWRSSSGRPSARPPAAPRAQCHCRRRRRPRRPTRRATGAAPAARTTSRGGGAASRAKKGGRASLPVRRRPPPLLARFGGDTSILDAFCDAYGLSAATGFPVESAFLLKRPKRSLLVIASAPLSGPRHLGDVVRRGGRRVRAV